MPVTSVDQAIAWERRGFTQSLKLITPAAPAQTWIAAQYQPPAPGQPGSYYAFLLTRISFGNLLPDVFTYYLVQQGQYADTNLLGVDTLRDGLNMLLTVTRHSPLTLWVLNNDVVAHRFDFTLYYTIVQTEIELEQVRALVQDVLTIPPVYAGVERKKKL